MKSSIAVIIKEASNLFLLDSICSLYDSENEQYKSSNNRNDTPRTAKIIIFQQTLPFKPRSFLLVQVVSTIRMHLRRNTTKIALTMINYNCGSGLG